MSVASPRSRLPEFTSVSVVQKCLISLGLSLGAVQASRTQQLNTTIESRQSAIKNYCAKPTLVKSMPVLNCEQLVALAAQGVQVGLPINVVIV